MKIRHYRPSDYPYVKEILEQGGLFWEISDSDEQLKRKIENDPGSIIVAEEDGKVVGTNFMVFDFLPFMFRVAVHQDHRGSGVFGQLMDRGEQMIKERGYHHVTVLVNTNHPEVQELYQKRGYAKGNTYVWMTKEF